MTVGGDLMDALSGRPCSLPSRAIVAALTPLSWLYVVGLEAYLLPYRIGWRRRHRLPCPVVSVGNLSSGGTGKTGLALTLVRALRSAGVDVCVLSRGYKGAHEGGVGVVSDREHVLLSPAEAGDEAFLLARALPGTPVVVGRDRRQTGDQAWERFRPQIVVLDDGMQYYQLHRDREITLLDANLPFGNGRTLPAGILREPPAHLRRSDWVVLSGMETENGSPNREVTERVKRNLGHSRILRGCYRGVGLRDMVGDERFELAMLAGRRVATICALGNPAQFERQVAHAGADVVHAVRYPDHYAPSEGEIREALDACMAAGAEAAIVSEKDAVKLGSFLRARGDAASANRGLRCPVWVFDAEFALDDMTELMQDLLSLAGCERPCGC